MVKSTVFLAFPHVFLALSRPPGYCRDLQACALRSSHKVLCGNLAGKGREKSLIDRLVGGFNPSEKY
jgi:hypothetical protein